MKKCIYIVLAAAAVVASCAKVDLKEDQKIEPKDGATAMFSGTIIQPNGLGGATRVSIIGEDEKAVYVRWDQGDRIWVKHYEDSWTTENQKILSAVSSDSNTEFTGNTAGWSSPEESYSARYFGKGDLWKEYVYKTSSSIGGSDPQAESVEIDCTVSEGLIPVSLENMPLHDEKSTEDKEKGSHNFHFTCEYAILQINVPSKLDYDDLYVCAPLTDHHTQEVTIDDNKLTEESKYAFWLKGAAFLKGSSKYAGQDYVSYFVPISASNTNYSYIEVVATKGTSGTDMKEVARMKTYEYAGDPDQQRDAAISVVANSIYFFDLCNTKTIKKDGTYNLESNNNIDYKVNIAETIEGTVTINAEKDGFEPANIFINNHGYTVGKLVIEAKNSHVEGANGFAGEVVANTSISTFVVKPTLHITGLTVKKGSVVVEGNENQEANVEKIIIPEGVTEQITIDVTGVSSITNRVQIVNYSAKEKVVVVADKEDKTGGVSNEYYVTEGPVTEVTKETVATIGETGYATLADAIAAVKDGETIVMVADVAAAEGISVESGKIFTVDFGGHTYSTECPGAGSAGTKTAAFQLLKNSTIVFKNGTINCTEANKDKTWVKTDTSKGIAIIIQNYANLTLEDMTIDGANIAHNGTTPRYVVSNNSGNVEFKGNTTISAPVTGDYAFDACKDNSYDAPVVTWNSTGSVKGMIDLTGGKFVVAKDLAVTEPVVAGEASAQSTLEVNAKLSAASAFSDPNTQISNKKSTAPLQVKRGADLSVCGNGTIEGAETYAAIVVAVAGDNESKTAKLTFDGVTAQGQYFGIAGNGTRHNTEIVINGGVIKGLHDKDNLGIFNPQAGSLTINGGEISGYSSSIEMRAGSLTINGGVFTAEAPEYKYAPSGSGNTTTGAAIAVAEHNTKKGVTVVLNKGTFTAERPLAVEDVNEDFDTNINITKAQDLDIAAPEGYEWSNNKLVKAVVKTVKVGDVYYDTLADAFAAVPANGSETTVTILADANETFETRGAFIDEGQNVILELNGKKLVGTSTKSGYTHYIYVENGGNLTINDKIGGGAIEYHDKFIEDLTSGESTGGSTIICHGCLTVNGGTIENKTADARTSDLEGAIDMYTNAWGKSYSPADIVLNFNNGTAKSNGSCTIRMTSFSAGKYTTSVTANMNGGEVIGRNGFFIQGVSEGNLNTNTLNLVGGKVYGVEAVRVFAQMKNENTSGSKPVQISIGNVDMQSNIGAKSTKTDWEEGICIQNLTGTKDVLLSYIDIKKQ